jgi:hypothetical protein
MVRKEFYNQFHGFASAPLLQNRQTLACMVEESGGWYQTWMLVSNMEKS